MTNRMNKVNKINKMRRNRAINAFKELTKVLPVDIICNTLMYFNSPSLLHTEIGKLSVEYRVYNKYYNLLKAIASYKTICVPEYIYVLRRSVRGFGGCVESFSITNNNNNDFILGIVKYGDLISRNTVLNTIDGDNIVAGPCGQLCIMENADYEICKRCASNPYCIYIK